MDLFPFLYQYAKGHKLILSLPGVVDHRTSLLFDHNQTPKPVSGELKTSRDLIKAMCKLNVVSNTFQ
jgi:hypothetical protein